MITRYFCDVSRRAFTASTTSVVEGSDTNRYSREPAAPERKSRQERGRLRTHAYQLRPCRPHEFAMRGDNVAGLGVKRLDHTIKPFRLHCQILAEIMPNARFIVMDPPGFGGDG